MGTRKCGCIGNTVDAIPASGPYAHLPHCNITQTCCVVAVLTIANECDCVKPCRYKSYDYSTSYSAFPADSEVESFAERYNVSSEVVQHSFLQIHIYFEQLIIQKEVTERSYTIDSLLSDLGGALGLFLGASVISLTEFLAWIVDEIKDRCFGINDREVINHLSTVKESLKEKLIENGAKETHDEMCELDHMTKNSQLENRIDEQSTAM